MDRMKKTAEFIRRSLGSQDGEGFSQAKAFVEAYARDLLRRSGSDPQAHERVAFHIHKMHDLLRRRANGSVGVHNFCNWLFRRAKQAH